MNINWFPGHMSKAQNEVLENIKKIDFVIEVVDSRAPFSSRNNNLLKQINKPKLIIFSKIDICDKNSLINWIQYYEKQGNFCLAVDLKKSSARSLIYNAINKLMASKVQKNRAKGIVNSSFRGMILGVPNVGKSTLINCLANRKSAKVADTPGLTRAQKLIKINEYISVLDTPGILWPKFENEDIAINLAIIGSIKESIIPINEIVKAVVIYLKKFYNVPLFNNLKMSDYNDFLVEYAKVKNLKESDNDILINKISYFLFKEIRDGKLGDFCYDQL